MTTRRPTKLEVFLTDAGSASAEYLHRMATFVATHHPERWSVESLNQCHLMEVADGDYVAALVWAHWFDGADRVLEIHACAAPDYRGRWLNRRTMECLFYLQPYTGARALIAQTRTPMAERIWRAFGFRIVGQVPYGLAVLDTENDWDGESHQESSRLLEAKGSEGPGAARGRGGRDGDRSQSRPCSSTSKAPKGAERKATRPVELSDRPGCPNAE